MPHLLIHCSENILKNKQPDSILQAVNDAALSTSLFTPETTKVRIEQFQHYLNGGTNGEFVHVFAHIMEGRNTDQKNKLSGKIIDSLKGLLPEVPFISVNVSDLDKSSYRKKQ